jgi:hypothetical protein
MRASVESAGPPQPVASRRPFHGFASLNFALFSFNSAASGFLGSSYLTLGRHSGQSTFREFGEKRLRSPQPNLPGSCLPKRLAGGNVGTYPSLTGRPRLILLCCSSVCSGHLRCPRLVRLCKCTRTKTANTIFLVRKTFIFSPARCIVKDGPRRLR